jgi:glycyl-tRNA synthetase beta subunit
VAVAELKKVETPKGEYVGATVKRGPHGNEILAAELPKEVLAIYWAKNMYWRAGKPERFVRPVRWVVALMDAAVVPLEIAGIAAAMRAAGIACCMARHRCRSSASAYKEACARRSSLRCGRAQADHSQGAGRGYAHGSRCALARG